MIQFLYLNVPLEYGGSLPFLLDAIEWSLLLFMGGTGLTVFILTFKKSVFKKEAKIVCFSGLIWAGILFIHQNKR